MKIGKGILELGILGLNNNRTNEKISVTDLGRLARQTLSFEPLSQIFTVSDMRTRTISKNNGISDYWRKLDEEIELIKQGKNPDTIAVIDSTGENIYEPGTKLIHSKPVPKIFAHEIGHALGLKHPIDRCNYLGCVEYIEECPYSRELMGCGLHSLGINGFSERDTTKLRGLLN
tara:strand:- start:1647 stop:2168 length:522 start_codon:yes stop_codon:yes gene_type:complete